jgi:hypothetical protein
MNAIGARASAREQEKATSKVTATRHSCACQRIGEISRDLEKAQYNKGHGTVVPSDGKYKAEKIGGHGKFKVPTDGKLKSEVLAEAGISTSTAQRYEELAGPKEEQAEAVISAATDAYFSQSSPSHFTGLRGQGIVTPNPLLRLKSIPWNPAQISRTGLAGEDREIPDSRVGQGRG